MPKRSTITEQLRAAIRQAEKRGVSRYRMAQISQVSQAQISRFMAGDIAPKLETAERIAEAIGNRLSLVKRR